MHRFLNGLAELLFPAEKWSADPKRIVLWAVVGVAAYASMLVRVSASPEGALYWGNCGIVAAVGFFLVAAVCFSRFACCGAGRVKGWFVALSAVISLLNVVGQALDASNSLALFYSGAPDATLFAFRVVGGAVFFYAVFCLLADIVRYVAARQKSGWVGGDSDRAALGQDCNSTGTESNPAASGDSLSPATYTLFGRKLTLPMQLGFIALCWLPYLVVFFPGSMPTDTARQLGQWFGTGGVPLDNHFPYLTTVLYGTVYSLGNAIESTGVGGMLALTVLQYAAGLAAFGLVLLVLRKLAAPKWLLVASTVFVALFPIIPTYVVSTSKDYLHALCVAVFCAQLLLLVVSCKNNQSPGKLASWWAIALVALLVCLTRNNGVVVAGVGLLAAAIALRSLKGGACLVGVMAVFLCWNSVLLPACNVQPTEPREALSLPAQVVARSYAMGYEPSAADAAVLAECISCSLQDLPNYYNPRISDPAKGVVVADKSQVAQYVGASLSVAAAPPWQRIGRSAWHHVRVLVSGLLGHVLGGRLPLLFRRSVVAHRFGLVRRHKLGGRVERRPQAAVPGVARGAPAHPRRFPSVSPGNVLLADSVRAGIRPAIQGEQEGGRSSSTALVGPVRYLGGWPLRLAALHPAVHLQLARDNGSAVLPSILQKARKRPGKLKPTEESEPPLPAAA